MADGIKVGDAYVEVTPSLDNFEERLRRKVKAAVRAVVADIDVTPKVHTATASAKTKALDSQLSRLGRKNVNVKVDVDTGRSQANVKALNSSLLGTTVSAKIFNAAILAGAGSLPVLAASSVAAVGAVGSLSSVLATAGIGLGAFGLAAAGNVSKVNEVREGVKKLNEQLADTKNAKERAKLIAERTRLLNTLTPAQTKLMHAIDGAAKAYDRFIDRTSKPVSRALVSWLKIARPGLKFITPIARNAADAVEYLGNRARKALQQPFWQKFGRLLSGTTSPAIRMFGQITGNVMTTVAGVVRAFMPDGMNLLRWIKNASEGWARWGKTLHKNKQFQRFMRNVRDLAPRVVELLKQAGRAVGNLIIALSESRVARVMIGVLTGFFRWLANHPQATKNALFGIAAGVVAIKTALAVGNAIGKVRTFRTNIAGLRGASTSAKGGLRGLAGMLRGGVWGVAIGGALLILGKLVQRHIDWRKDIGKIKGTLKGEAAAVSRSTKRWVINDLVRSGAAKKARQFGISLDTLRRAALGEEDAIRKVNRQLRTNSTRQHQSINLGNGQRKVIGQVTGEERGLAKQLGLTSRKLKQSQKETREANRLREGLKTKTMQARDAGRKWRDAIAAASKAVSDNSGKVNKNTREYKQDREAIEAATKKAGDHIVKMVKSGRTFNDVTAQAKKHREQLRRVANQLGLTKDETQKLIDKYNLTPKQIRTLVKTPGMQAAINKTKTLKDKLIGLEGKYAVSFGTSGTGYGESLFKGTPYAKGGPVRGPGTGTSDSIPARLSNGEHVWTDQEVDAAGGHGAMYAMRRAVMGFAKGGAVTPEVIINARSIADRVGGALKKINAIDWIDLSSFGGGSGNWAGVMKQALAIMGQPMSLLGVALARLNQESGGQPGIVNRWDSNWKAGIPSVGLMQVIGPTYQAYKHPAFDVGPYLYGSSINPLANILASMRYAIARYGSLVAAYTQPGGYANGGRPKRDEVAWVGERGPELVKFRGGERVYSNRESRRMAGGRLSDRQWRTLRRLADRAGLPGSVRRFVGRRPALDERFIANRLDRPGRGPMTVKGFRKALRERAKALRVVRREREQLHRLRKRERSAEKRGNKLSRLAEEHPKKFRDEIQRNRKAQTSLAKSVGKAEKNLGNARDKLSKQTDRVRNAQQRYTKAQKAAVGRARDIAGGVRGTADLFFSTSARHVAESFKQALRHARAFNKLVRKLHKAGMHPALLRKFIEAGPSFETVALGRNLLSNRGEMREINEIYRKLGVVGERIGAFGATPRRYRNVTRFANGGLVTQPTNAIIGEAGPELVLPLSRPNRAGDLMDEAGIGGTHYHAHFDGTTRSGVQHEVRTAFRAMSVQKAHSERIGRRR